MKRWLVIAAIAFISALVPVTEGWTAVRTHAFYLSTMAGAYFFESDDPLKNSAVYTLGVGYSFSERWAGEIVAGYTKTRDGDDENEQIDGYPLRLDVLYSFRPKERLVPHLAVGFGGMLLDDPGGNSDVESVFGYGVGLRYFLGRSMALRADVRHLYVRENLRFEKGQGNNHLMANAGVSFQIGGGMIPPPQIDSDGDGVIDAFDRCPGTPLGVPVDVYGCPADSDGDGVPDYRDRCPDTPYGVKVDEHGCPIKAEVGDSPKIFSPPPNGVQVAPTARPAINRVQGTVAEEISAKAPSPVTEITILIPFAAGQAEIRPESTGELKGALDFVRAHPARLIVVEGHTDSIGGAEANLALSRKRAENVRRYLLQETGLSPERIEIRGYGESRPVGDNATQEGRRQNRRVVIRAE
jgi:OmpA-OmpF porin, OOP family